MPDIQSYIVHQDRWEGYDMLPCREPVTEEEIRRRLAAAEIVRRYVDHHGRYWLEVETVGARGTPDA